MNKNKIKELILKLTPLVASLEKVTTVDEKLALLNNAFTNPNDRNQIEILDVLLSNKTREEEYAVKAIFIIGQASIVFNMKHAGTEKNERIKKLLNRLIEVENFYGQIGGIIGYHLSILQLILSNEESLSDNHKSVCHPPEGLYINQENAQVRQSVRWGLDNLDKIVEIYPIGGAGDRLNLIDESTGKPHPVAMLPFMGRSLLEGLIRDLQALEYLYYKLYKKQLHTPIAMMTSEEKDNHHKIQEIVESHGWFGRSPDSYYFFMQPSVPVITIDGNWSLSSYLQLTLKPGGHGVIWKLAQEKGVLDQLVFKKRPHAILRQINNPLAGIDGAIIALSGIGCTYNKSMGFLSCERLTHSAEGVNVLIESQNEKGFSYRITNIEYTDFVQKGINDTAISQESSCSSFPANTNILYVNIQAIQKALKKCSIPGKLINMKTKVPFIDEDGNLTEVKGGRLESTMQNIADYLEDNFLRRLQREEYHEKLQTFIIFNDRAKTISTTKNSYKIGESPLSTPEQAYFDYLTNNIKLFKEKCRFLVPPPLTLEEYLKDGPNCIILFHPALGPLYSIIAQKIRRGKLANNAELQLEIAEVDISDLDLDGSLIIESKCPLGNLNSKNIIQYGNENRCTLHHVQIRNQGIHRQSAHHYWKNQILNRESLKIILNEGSEFHAENISIQGNFIYEVPAYHRMVISSNKIGENVVELTKIEKPTWHWNYAFDADNHVILRRIDRK
jgi:hypothetical protein